MNADEWDDLLNDVHAELLYPNGTRDCRYKLAEKLAEMEQRLEKIERTAASAAYTASCLANGIQPD